MHPVFLLPAPDGDEPVGRLGGDPDLPAEVAWPQWEGHGPLSFVAAIDCAAMAAQVTEYAWPADGTLLFFYFDGQADNGESWVTPADPASKPGSRVLHVPATAATAPRPAPAVLTPFPAMPLTAVHAPSFDASHDRHHQIGGCPDVIQNEIDTEVAMWALGREYGDDDPDEDEDYDPFDDPEFDPEVRAEAERWKLLLQVASDRNLDMMWGDAGALYWMIKPEDLAELRLDLAYFTWQCH